MKHFNEINTKLVWFDNIKNNEQEQEEFFKFITENKNDLEQNMMLLFKKDKQTIKNFIKHHFGILIKNNDNKILGYIYIDQWNMKPEISFYTSKEYRSNKYTSFSLIISTFLNKFNRFINKTENKKGINNTLIWANRFIGTKSIWLAIKFNFYFAFSYVVFVNEFASRKPIFNHFSSLTINNYFFKINNHIENKQSNDRLDLNKFLNEIKNKKDNELFFIEKNDKKKFYYVFKTLQYNGLDIKFINLVDNNLLIKYIFDVCKNNKIKNSKVFVIYDHQATRLYIINNNRIINNPDNFELDYYNFILNNRQQLNENIIFNDLVINYLYIRNRSYFIDINKYHQEELNHGFIVQGLNDYLITNITSNFNWLKIKNSSYYFNACEKQYINIILDYLDEIRMKFNNNIFLFKQSFNQIWKQQKIFNKETLINFIKLLLSQ